MGGGGGCSSERDWEGSRVMAGGVYLLELGAVELEDFFEP